MPNELLTLPKGTIVDRDETDYIFRLPDGTVKRLSLAFGDAVITTAEKNGTFSVETKPI